MGEACNPDQGYSGKCIWRKDRPPYSHATSSRLRFPAAGYQPEWSSLFPFPLSAGIKEAAYNLLSWSHLPSKKLVKALGHFIRIRHSGRTSADDARPVPYISCSMLVPHKERSRFPRHSDAPGCAPRPSGRLRTAVPWCIGVPVEGEHLEKWGRTKEDLLAAVFSIPW